MYSTLIFDLSEVFISGLQGVEKTLAPRVGWSDARVMEALFAPPTFEFFRGEVTESTFLEGLIERNEWTAVSAQEIAQVVRDNFSRRVDGTQPVIEKLAPRYELALLSDHAREWMDFVWQQHPFLSIFPNQFFSFDLGHTKRESVAFSLVLERLHRTAGECLFVDDLESNIRVAASVGLKGILFKDSQQLVVDLRAAGIAVD